MKQHRSFVLIILGAMASLGLTIILNQSSIFNHEVAALELNITTVIDQAVIKKDLSTHTVFKVAVDDELVGYIHDYNKVQALLNSVYKNEYSENFPNSSVVFGKRITVAPEPSFLYYEDKDDELVAYLADVNDYMITTNAIDFSDENGTYATIYVQDESIYNEALMDYLGLFVGSDLELLRTGGSHESLNEYGSQNVDIDIVQDITMRKAYAYVDEIMTRYDQVFYYLKYGTESEIEYTQVQPYESIYALASRYGLDSERLRILNSETIKNVDQSLVPGTDLIVTWLNSPIDVVVQKETLTNEIVYPDSPIYVEDETVRVGESIVQQEAMDGSRNVLRLENWVNGQVVDAVELSSQTVTMPQQAIIRQGTKVIPGIGTGTWRWPVDVPRISSRVNWDPVHPGYYGHNGTDIQNFYNRYGNIYAVDNGVVEYVGYDSVRGNWCLINHNNGLKSQYNHMNVPPFVTVGQVVEKGDIIGQIGTTGKTTGPHVHLGVWVNGVAGNACDYLNCDGLDW